MSKDTDNDTPMNLVNVTPNEYLKFQYEFAKLDINRKLELLKIEVISFSILKTNVLLSSGKPIPDVSQECHAEIEKIEKCFNELYLNVNYLPSIPKVEHNSKVEKENKQYEKKPYYQKNNKPKQPEFRNPFYTGQNIQPVTESGKKTYASLLK